MGGDDESVAGKGRVTGMFEMGGGQRSKLTGFDIKKIG